MNHPNGAYIPDLSIEEVSGFLSETVEPADFPAHKIRYRNSRWASAVGLGELSDADWIGHFSRFKSLENNLPEPLALAYHGHQFGTYNPDLGDGRGFLFAQLRDGDGRLLDLGTKGSGQTPWSRQGDGRLTLKGGVREALATQMLEMLGVNTSKTFSVIETGEELYRGDEPSPTRSCVMVRLSHSHIRFGTFQRLAYMGNAEAVEALVLYCIRHYHPVAARPDIGQAAPAFLREVMVATADMIASWMAAGFVHGVMNTDNMVVTGESFDYGPYRFVPVSDPNFVAAYFDQTGRYRFGRQPSVGAWNLGHLAGCLALVCEVEDLEAVLGDYAQVYQAAFRRHMFRRLGLMEGEADADGAFIQTFLTWFTQSGAAWEQTFFDWFCGGESEARANAGPQADLYANAAFDEVRAGLTSRRAVRADRLSNAYFSGTVPVNLTIDTIENVWSKIADEDDWSAFHTLLDHMCVASSAYLWR